jgi:beta-galactosidase
MYFGSDYYPEHWVHPYDGTEENPEAGWEKDAELMAKAGMNVVRMGEFSWGLCEREEGRFDFAWLRRAMDVMAKHGIKIVLGTPTAAPPIWVSQKYPQILPIDEQGHVRSEGTRRAYCMNSDKYWELCRAVVRAMAGALGDHPNLIAWQIDNGIGRHNTEYSFNPQTQRDWQAWLKAKYGTIDHLNKMLGLNFWGQVVTDWAQVPMPKAAPASHNPALVTDWRRFSSDTCVAFVRMQSQLLRELTPKIPTTTPLRPWVCEFDYFDMAEAVDFVSVDSNAATRTEANRIACGLDLMRCLKKKDVKAPEGSEGFWVMEQKAGAVNWQDVNSQVRPGGVRLFTYQLLSRGADGVLYFYWRMPRIGPEKFYGGVLTHDGQGTNRIYEEVRQIGEEIKRLEPILKGTKITAEACIIVSFQNHWAINQPQQPNKHFSQLEHIQLFYNALHDRNILVDFARPPRTEEDSERLQKYKLVIAPSLHMIEAGEADRLALYVHNGGTLISTCNTGLVDQHHIVPNNGWPYEMQDLFGLRVTEFDAMPPGQENHLNFKGTFPTSHLHPARLWCDMIEPTDCQVVGTYTKDFYSGKPAMTVNEFGSGKAVYFGTVSQQGFYADLINWARQQCNMYPLMKVPDSVEVSMCERENGRVFFILNHQENPVRLHFYKPTHDYLSEKKFSGNYDIPSHGVLVLDEQLNY